MLASAGTLCAEKKSIVCTSFPGYDWVRSILGERMSDWNVRLLQNKGTDSHSWQPSFADIAAIETADIFVYNGGESDAWVSKALKNVINPAQASVNLMDRLGGRAKAEEIVEGMQTEDRYDGECRSDGETEYDEHIWLSLRNAMMLADILTEVIVQADSDNEALYNANNNMYKQRIAELDREYEAAVSAAPHKTVIFGDRFPFRYMTDDYGLQYYAAFAGCSAESEASFDTVIFLARKIDDLGLRIILTIDKSDKKLAKTIAANTKTKKIRILEMDSLQSVTLKDIKKGKTYLSAMKNNLEMLKQALNNL